MNNVLTIGNVRGYLDGNGTAMISLEDASRGLGFTQVKGLTEYVRWETVNSYLVSFGFSQDVGKDTFIPENIFYRLAMKASNSTAESFQAKVCDEILPSIRRTGGYNALPKTYLEALKDLVATTEALELAAPKAQYFDKIVERGNLLNFRDTAKCLGIKQGEFMKFLETKYIYRDSKGKPKPYAEYVGTLFELKEYAGGVQCLVTVVGKQRFMETLSTERNSG